MAFKITGWQIDPMEQVDEAVRETIPGALGIERLEHSDNAVYRALDMGAKIDYVVRTRRKVYALAVRAQNTYQDMGTVTLRWTEEEQLLDDGGMTPEYLAHFYEGGTVAHIVHVPRLVKRWMAGDITPTRIVNTEDRLQREFLAFAVADMADEYVGRYPKVDPFVFVP